MKILNCEVIFHDDKKEKSYSHEAMITKNIETFSHNGYGNLEVVGYGSTKEEALEDLKSGVKNLIEGDV